jgi:GT2 family glycosyltransferase
VIGRAALDAAAHAVAASARGVDTGPWARADVRVAIAVCTRDRPDELAACLAALRRVDHDDLEILVVDNAPSDKRTEDHVRRVAHDDGRVRYVCEPEPGLSRARNRALAEATAELLAFTDDDVRVDRRWVHGLLTGFARGTDVGCVTGLVAAATLDTAAEQYFDARVWWSSDVKPRLFRGVPSCDDGPLHPYTAGRFGTGANVAFRVDDLHAVGGFDEALGAGSLTGGGEDLDVFVRLLRAGYAVAYEPRALVWHLHRADDASLHRQMYSYGKGLAAYLTKYLVSRRTGLELLARSPQVLVHAARLAGRSERASVGAGLPRRSLARAEARGMLAGPVAYARARRRVDPAQRQRVQP